MKFISIFLFLFTALFAHTAGDNHLHFFSTLHIEAFTLLMVGFIAAISIYKYINREIN